MLDDNRGETFAFGATFYLFCGYNSIYTTFIVKGNTLRTGSLFAKSHLQALSLKYAFACCFLLLLSSIPQRLLAQNGATNVGGSWTEYDSEDKMTAARRVRFVLRSGDNPQEPKPFQARVEIFCENGSYKAGNFTPGIPLARPNRPGFWGQPQMEVTVRINNSHSSHGWNWSPDSLSMDKGTVREMLGAELLRIEFLGNRGPQIAEFSPAGLDLERVSKACGLTPKKP
jgi:hypothetical protein